MTARPLWTIVDSRTDEPVTMSCYLTRRQAEEQIDEWRARDSKGRRQDVRHLVPHLVARQLDGEGA